MDITFLLLLAAGGALILPFIGGDDGDDDRDDEIRGTLGSDPELNGTEGNDRILGFDGDDTINGLGGLDFINAGLGNDTVNGGDGRDEIEGRAGNDILNGDDGGDVIRGGAGDDTINGGYGNDVIEGGEGNDIIFGGAAARPIGDDGELVNATDRTDSLRGQGGEDSVYIWGGDGQAFGGFNRDDAPIPEVDEKDELILVTGEARLSDGEGTTDFFVLANNHDDEETFATIGEFDESEHRLILTVDIDPGQTATPQIGLRIRDEDFEGENGLFVEAVLLNANEFDEGSYETSGAFFRGENLPDGLLPVGETEGEFGILPDNTVDVPVFDVAVVVTNLEQEDYFTPQDTVAAIKGVIPDNPAVPPT